MASKSIAFTNAHQGEPSRQQHPKSNKHPPSTPQHAKNPSTTNDTPTTESARANRTSGARSTLRAHQASHACAHHLRGRTTLPETFPSSQRSRSGAPKQPTHHDDSARTATFARDHAFRLHRWSRAAHLTLSGPSDPEASSLCGIIRAAEAAEI